MRCDFELVSGTTHRCRRCRRGWHGQLPDRECIGGNDLPRIPREITFDQVTLEIDEMMLPDRESDRVVVTLAVGDLFQSLLDVSGPLNEGYAKRCQADYREIRLPSSAYPQGDKFRLLQFLSHGYREVLFIDADALVMPHAESLFDMVPVDMPFAIHEDLPMIPDASWIESEFRNLIDSQQWDCEPIQTCYNTGVMLIRESARMALEMPLRPFPRTHTAEQSLINLNIARHEIPVHLLGREWNEQWWFKCSLPERDGTRIYHWANAPHAERLAEMRDRAGKIDLGIFD